LSFPGGGPKIIEIPLELLMYPMNMTGSGNILHSHGLFANKFVSEIFEILGSNIDVLRKLITRVMEITS